MSSTATALSSNEAQVSRRTWTSRISSLLGFLPLGVWTVNHLWDNLAAFRGAEAWQESVTQYANPVSHALTLTIVLLPLLAHTVWGIKRLFSFRPEMRQKNYGNFKYLLQRLSAVGLLFFLGAHLWLAMLEPRLVRGQAEAFTDIAAHMRHHPPTLLVYILGVAGIAYHLANGLSSLFFRFGITYGRASERRLEVVVYAFFALLCIMGFGAIYALWDAGGPLPVPET